MNTTTRKARLSMLEDYYAKHLPENRVEMAKLFYDFEQAMNWKDSVELDGHTFDFYDYFETRVNKEA